MKSMLNETKKIQPAKSRLWEILQHNWFGFFNKKNCMGGGDRKEELYRLKKEWRKISTTYNVWILFGSWFKQVNFKKKFWGTIWVFESWVDTEKKCKEV